jgi:hypothetical protein
MKKVLQALLGFSVFALISDPAHVFGADPAVAPLAGAAGDYVLTFAKICVTPTNEVQVDETNNTVRETMTFHDVANASDKVTGKCVLEYTWSKLPGRFSSKALDKIEAKSSISVTETSGEWTVRPKEIRLNMFFFKAGDKDVLDATKAGKWDAVSPYERLKLKVMSLRSDQYPTIDEMVSNQNQAKWLPFARSWKGQTMTFTPADYPQAVLIVKVKGLYVDGYACYVYEYDPQGKKTPLQQ